MVPTRNRYATLRRTFASVAAQTRSDLEIIGVDEAANEPANLAGAIAPDRLTLPVASLESTSRPTSRQRR